MYKPSQDLTQMIHAASAKDEQYVIDHLAEHVDHEGIDWAMGPGIVHRHTTVRELAALILCRSSVPLTLNDQRRLEAIMRTESPIIAHRVAIALYRRGNRQSSVEAQMDRSLADPILDKLMQNVTDE